MIKTDLANHQRRVQYIRCKSLRVFIVFIILMQCSVFVDANALTRHSLTHRSPEDIKHTLLPLLPDNSTIVVDHNGVIVSAPASMKKNITALIRQMDKPHQQLVVTVFRGRHPERKGHIIHSTQHGAQMQERIITQNGQAIAITNNNVVRIPISHRIDSKDILQRSKDNVEGNQSVAPSPLIQQHSELVDAPTGLYLRATVPAIIQDNTWVNITSTIVSAVKPSGDEKVNRQKKEHIALTRSVESIYRIPINQWYLLSSQQQFSHPADLAAQGGSSTAVYSTAARTNQQSVWIKVEVVE